MISGFFFQRLRNNSNIFVDLDSPELFAKLGRFHLKEATCTLGDSGVFRLQGIKVL